jgi:hypothetical protein
MNFDRPITDIDAWLESFRSQIDALGAAAAVEVMASGKMRGGDLIDALEGCAKAGGKASAQLLDEAATVPAWVDFERMLPGSKLGLRTPVQSGLALVLGSLMESYASAKGAKVLIRGGRLESQVIARLRDTTSFVLQVAASRGPRPGTAAHRHIIRTRMVHAFVRHGVLKRNDWREEWGRPINQEDYASTLLAFCHVYLRCMHALGVNVTDEEERSVHHLFRWVGQVMGVAPELLSQTREEERLLYLHITRRQLHPDEDSKVLAHALIGALAGRGPLFLPAPALEAICRQLLGEGLSDGLELKRSEGRWIHVGKVMPVVSSVQRAAERLPGMLPRLESIGERVARLVFTRGLNP